LTAVEGNIALSSTTNSSGILVGIDTSSTRLAAGNVQLVMGITGPGATSGAVAGTTLLEETEILATSQLGAGGNFTMVSLGSGQRLLNVGVYNNNLSIETGGATTGGNVNIWSEAPWTRTWTSIPRAPWPAM